MSDHPDGDEDERGVCMNCGGDMDFSPMHPWCEKCDEEDERDEREREARLRGETA